ncbi:tRNA (adenosine(37)-N6)-threonylcarbamoyltransferase complex ATPase subunit type 1 TsaE [Sneathiella chinensis]|nr:tRNA (adenosine(37)-N6)-threonylcarbamoyltransferase complex ATPase subunit type 1 TsaE [Sneathiella chinensis]
MDQIVSLDANSLDETDAIAARLGALLQPADIITLSGTLGAGKTAFARSLIRSLTTPGTEVPSPTFNLLLTYDCADRDLTIYHYDLYRLEDPEEVFELDIEDAFDMGLSLIEWADRMGPFLPEERLDITLEICGDAAGNGTRRRIVFSGGPDWADRLQPLMKDRT